METLLQYIRFFSLFMLFLSVHSVPFTGKGDVETQKNVVGVEIKCGEVEVSITVKRHFLEEKHIPFKPENLRLGTNSTQQRSCAAKGPVSDSEMVISAGLHECGTESRVRGEWLIYSNQLVLFPAVVPTSTSVIVKGATTVITIECHYKRRQTVNAEPLTPTWLPLTSTISVFGLLHFSLRAMADDCTSVRSSSVYQQGEAVFLEASVEAPLHSPLTMYVDYCVATLKPDPLSSPSYKFISKNGCLMDSVLPGSSSRFLPREQDNRLCFSFQAFHFNQEYGKEMFISCHMRAILRQKSHSHLNKSCFFHRPTFSWRATEGDDALCGCCDYDDCFRQTAEENHVHTGHTTQPDTEKNHEEDTTVGPLHTLPHFHRTGRLSVNH
ncbi:zona pellucida sperm-binding protein 3-like isoform X2 [Centropristis striata]|uniref:zona pellucida sperm-binding protein 3-like isoform X2 n=1 Tax=Centropristis striata TaxID=184440 RepID=UPI0027E0409E|nr:zona pellucida sperm-binding protein 3-like isoform X2 [Centropristis striata]